MIKDRELNKNFERIMAMPIGRELDKFVISDIMKIPIFENQDDWGKNHKKYPYSYYSESDNGYLLISKLNDVTLFTPSISMDSAWVIVNMMAKMMEDNHQFKWQGPIYNANPNSMMPFGGKFGKKCWFIWIVHTGIPKVVTADTPSEAICKGGGYVAELIGFFLRQKKKMDKKKSRIIKPGEN